MHSIIGGLELEYNHEVTEQAVMKHKSPSPIIYIKNKFL